MGFFQSLLLLVALAVVLLGYRLSTFARVAPGLKNSVGWQCERFEHPGTEDFATDGKRVYISTVVRPVRSSRPAVAKLTLPRISPALSRTP